MTNSDSNNPDIDKDLSVLGLDLDNIFYPKEDPELDMKECIACGKEYIPKIPKQKYCSDKCRLVIHDVARRVGIKLIEASAAIRVYSTQMVLLKLGILARKQEHLELINEQLQKEEELSEKITTKKDILAAQAEANQLSDTPLTEVDLVSRNHQIVEIDLSGTEKSVYQDNNQDNNQDNSIDSLENSGRITVVDYVIDLANETNRVALVDEDRLAETVELFIEQQSGKFRHSQQFIDEAPEDYFKRAGVTYFHQAMLDLGSDEELVSLKMENLHNTGLIVSPNQFIGETKDEATSRLTSKPATE